MTTPRALLAETLTTGAAPQLVGPDGQTWQPPTAAIISYAHLVLTSHSAESPQNSLLDEEAAVEFLDSTEGAVLALSAGTHTLRIYFDRSGMAQYLCSEPDCFDTWLYRESLYCAEHLPEALLGRAVAAMGRESHQHMTNERALVAKAQKLIGSDGTHQLLDAEGIGSDRAHALADPARPSWTLDMVANHMGLTADAARKAMARAGVEPIGREPGRGGSNCYDPEQVKAAAAARPGRGNHAPQ